MHRSKTGGSNKEFCTRGTLQREPIVVVLCLVLRPHQDIMVLFRWVQVRMGIAELSPDDAAVVPEIELGIPRFAALGPKLDIEPPCTASGRRCRHEKS